MIRWIALRGGRTVSRLVLYPLVAYFWLARPEERRASRDFLSVVLRRTQQRSATAWDVCKHIYTFAATILDRVFLLTQGMGALDIRLHGREGLYPVLNSGRGMLLLGSHLGSFEALRALGRSRPGTRIVILMKVAQADKMVRALKAIDPDGMLDVIDADQNPITVVHQIKQALDAGAVVTMLGDRTSPGENSVTVSFFDRPMQLPTSAFTIASLADVPVWTAFGLYRGGRRYDLIFEQFAQRIELPRGQRAEACQAYAQQFAERLERHALDAPYNWFNFYPVWHDDAADSGGANARG